MSGSGSAKQGVAAVGSCGRGGEGAATWLLRLMLTVAVVQIKTLLGSCAASEKEKCQELRDEWLLGSAKRGVADVGKEVRMLHSIADTAAPYTQHC